MLRKIRRAVMLLNTDLERKMENFHAGNDEGIREMDLISQLADAVNVSVYGRIEAPKPSTSAELRFASNEGFWGDVMAERVGQGVRVRLNRFQITEWIPSSPGRFFTKEAVDARVIAEHYLRFDRSEYLPLGKMNMVLGGVGSLRLAPRQMGAKEMYTFGATSNGISHQGVPILLSEDEAQRVLPHIRSSGGCRANISGYIKVIQKDSLPLNYDVEVPKYLIFVDRLEVLGSAQGLLVTVAISFGSPSTPNRKFWSFCSFNPATQSPKDAADWLRAYAERYSESQDTQILSDFDEHVSHFNKPIEFPLDKVLHGEIDIVRLLEYQDAMNVTFNISGDLVRGDKNIYGNSIRGNSVTIIRGP